jgi:hypothetical protein
MIKSLIKDQRGVGHVVIIVAVVVLAAIGAVGYRITQNSDSVTKNASPAVKAAISACEKTLKDKDLCKFTGNYDIERQAYKMVITSSGKDGKSTATMSSDGKGNTSFSTSAAEGSFDTVSVNNITYMKDATDGKWWKYPASDTTAPKNDNPVSDLKIKKSDDKLAKDTYSYKKLGKEKCGKLTCLKYQIIDSTRPKATDYIWFDTKDYRMQRYSSTEGAETTDMVITYTNVKINVPSPTKDFSAGPSAADSAAIQQALQQFNAGTDTTSADSPSDTSVDQ